MTRPRRGTPTVDVMDYWRPEDDTEEDRRQGLRHIDPALKRAWADLREGGIVQLPPGKYRGFENDPST